MSARDIIAEILEWQTIAEGAIAGIAELVRRLQSEVTDDDVMMERASLDDARKMLVEAINKKKEGAEHG